jgi:hypothetical protein
VRQSRLGLDQSEKAAILKTLADFTDVFHLPGDKHTCTPTLKHYIKLTLDQPIFIKQYQTPFQMKEVLATRIHKKYFKIIKEKWIQNSDISFTV